MSAPFLKSRIKIVTLCALELDLQQAQFDITAWQAYGLVYFKVQLKLSLCKRESSTYNKCNFKLPLGKRNDSTI